VCGGPVSTGTTFFSPVVTGATTSLCCAHPAQLITKHAAIVAMTFRGFIKDERVFYIWYFAELFVF
jgi:hypothetical protein